MNENRVNCPMRHENGNCLPCGGFCLAVNDEICEALLNAYHHGFSDASNVIPMYKECVGYACRGLTENEMADLGKMDGRQKWQD